MQGTGTDATRSSVEAVVMTVERRRAIIQLN